MAINPFEFNTQFEDGGFDADSGGQSELTPAQPQAKPAPSADVINKLTQQILSRGTTGWTGEGLGSAQANAADMAKILAGIGITDVSQFGKFTQTGIPVEVRPDGRGGFVDDKGKAVNPSLVQEQVQSGEGGEFTSYTAPVGTQEVFGNKVTKQAVPETYGERQTGNFFGGTFAGKGNTGYGVQFDAQGNPTFYTQGASSSDVASNPVAALAVAYFLPVIGAEIAATLGTSAAVGTAIASTAVSVAQGVPLEEAIKNAATNLLISTATGSVTGTKDAKDFISSISTDPATQNIITNVSNSVINTVAKGGSGNEILTNAVSAAAGTVIGQETGSQALGQGAGTLLATGDPMAAASAVAGSLGSAKAKEDTKTTDKTVSSVDDDVMGQITKAFESPAILTARSELMDAINSANLTPEQREFLTAAMKDVQLAQALPATTSDAGGGVAPRLGLPFAANDPRFAEALKNNPQLIQKFSEYTNTYGFNTPQLNVVYKSLIEDELKKDPTYQPLLDEYKKITGTDYSPPVQDVGIIEVVGKREPAATVEPTPEPPANIVISVDPVKKTALVIDNSGQIKSTVIPPDVTVKPNDPVSVDPATNVVTPVPVAMPPVGPVVEPVPAPEPTPAAPTPAPSVTPAPAPGVTPEPTPAPAPITEPTPAPAPAPVPAPEPTPEPVVQPAPAPAPGRQPLIEPEPTPAPSPEPVPEPLPSPAPAPAPSPAPEPLPTPSPAPSPFPEPVTAPQPFPEPFPEPLPEPLPEPVPVSPPVATPPSRLPELLSPTLPTILQPSITTPSISQPTLVEPEPVTPEPPAVVPEPSAEPEPTKEPEPTVEPEPKTTEPEVEKEPDPFIRVGVSSLKPKKGQPTTRATDYSQSALAQALTAYRGAGEIEGDPSGKPRKNVWNEASLRLKDALGL